VRDLVVQPLVAGGALAALSQIQRDALRRAPQLIREVSIKPLDGGHDLSKVPDQLE
jgi:hypothetical protein